MPKRSLYRSGGISWQEQAKLDVARYAKKKPKITVTRGFFNLESRRAYEVAIATQGMLGTFATAFTIYDVGKQRTPIIVNKQVREPSNSALPGYELFSDIDVHDLETW